MNTAACIFWTCGCARWVLLLSLVACSVHSSTIVTPPAPAIPGLNADPHIAAFDDTFYLYPTTDGSEGWRSTSFRTWSSKDLINWRDGRVILDLPRDLTWAQLHAWAPAIATKNGKYYFYYSAAQNIGVAIADAPVGPFKDPLGRPLVAKSDFPRMQAIDPMVFVDGDGTAYLYWGQGRCKAVKLNEDMISFNRADVGDLTPPGYNEGPFVHKRGGTYYLTWSEHDTRDPRYCVSYAVGNSAMGPFKKAAANPILQQKGAVKGAGHHSILKLPGRDQWVIAYHRFHIPDGNGYNRETCLSPLRYAEDGSILPVDVFEGVTDAIGNFGDAPKIAVTPPMGWNSWDCFGTTITEAQVKQQADFLAEKLREHGWEYVVVDIQWYEPQSKGHDYRKDAKLAMDEFGRLQPAPEKFPSAAGERGFKPLADYVHSKGLKFGVHLMRGIPRQAVHIGTSIKGTSYRAADIADTNSICKWNPDMYGVDVSRPGGQEYYNSVFEMFAAWGVDFVKVDDISRPYDAVQKAETEAIRVAIEKSKRLMVLSLSPGETPLNQGEHVRRHANMWRISDDFWDAWPQLLAQFKRLHDWSPYRRPGAWPDADMLPLGVVSFGRKSRFTQDEQITMMTLWCIARSPLMHGGDLTKTDEFTLSLLTNDEVLGVNQHSANNRQLFRTPEGLIAWTAEVPSSSDKYLAVFNTQHSSENHSPTNAATIKVALADLGFAGGAKVRDLWQKKDVGKFSGVFSAQVSPHGARLFRLAPAQLPSQGLAPGETAKPQ